MTNGSAVVSTCNTFLLSEMLSPGRYSEVQVSLPVENSVKSLQRVSGELALPIAVLEGVLAVTWATNLERVTNLHNRYLLEMNELQELQSLCNVNKDAILGLEKGAELHDMLSSILSYLGQMYGRSGHARQSVECLEKSLEIRLQLEDDDENYEMEVSWSQHNIGEAYELLGDLETAHSWFQRCVDTWKHWSTTQASPQKLDYSTFQRKSMATCLLYMGRVMDSRHELEPLLTKDFKMAAENWAVAA